MEIADNNDVNDGSTIKQRLQNNEESKQNMNEPKQLETNENIDILDD